MGWLPPTRFCSLTTVVSVLLACPFSCAQAPPPSAAIPAPLPPPPHSHPGDPETIAAEGQGDWPHGQPSSDVRTPEEEPATPPPPRPPASPAPPQQVSEAGQPMPTNDQHEGKQLDGPVPSGGCSYKVFFAMPCVPETSEQELHLILTGGGSGCHFFKRLAKDCQMPVSKADEGVVVVPESSKFAALLRDPMKRDKTDIELYLGELLMAGEDLPSAVVTTGQERARFVEEMLTELAVFDTQHKADPIKKVPSPDDIIGLLRQGMQKKASEQEASSPTIDQSNKVDDSVPRDHSPDNLHESDESHQFPHSHIGHVPEVDNPTKSTPKPVIEASLRSLSTDVRGGSSNKTSGDVLKDEISRAVKLGYAAGFKAGTEKSSDEEVELQADNGDESDENDPGISDLMKLLYMYKRYDNTSKKPETNNWTIKNMPNGKQKILIFQ